MKKIALVLILSLSATAFAKINFWDVPRKGANSFSHEEKARRFQELGQLGFSIMRMVFSKWKSQKPGAKDGDFLVGSLDSFESIVPEDLETLRPVLDEANKAGIKIILTPLSLPGARWKQQNEGKLDSRLWDDFKYHEMSAQFWKQVATALKGHPAIYAYNILNEPYPEAGRFQDWYTGDYEAWYAKVKGTPADLNLFYRRVVGAIREVDAETPLMLDSGFYTTPWAYKYLEPLKDAKTLYALHMYEPYSFTNYKQDGSVTYPGKASIGEAEPPPVLDWNREALSNFFSPVRAWMKRHEIPASRIVASEFGVCRHHEGAAEYLRDLVSVFNEEKWHWAFYAFQEDGWTGMDYQLGRWKLPAKYWEELEKGNDTRRLYYRKNPLFDAFLNGLP